MINGKVSFSVTLSSLRPRFGEYSACQNSIHRSQKVAEHPSTSAKMGRKETNADKVSDQCLKMKWHVLTIQRSVRESASKANNGRVPRMALRVRLIPPDQLRSSSQQKAETGH